MASMTSRCEQCSRAYRDQCLKRDLAEETSAAEDWNRQEYLTAQDAEWGSPKQGQVDVGELENVAPAQDATLPDPEPTPKP